MEMDKWAANPEYSHVAFFCICVEGTPSLRRQVAMTFVKELRIASSFVGHFVQDSEMPRFGQLGCQGFILALPDGRVAVARSPAWVEQRGQAIRWMEKVFETLKDGSEDEEEAEEEEDHDERDDDTNSLRCEEQEGCSQASCESSSSNKEQSCAQATSESKSCQGGACSVRACFRDVGSVKVDSMDDEHAETVALLRVLEQNRDVSALKAALECMARHFEHEEQLLVEHGFGGLASTIVMEGHVGDHKAILGMMRTEASQCEIMKREVSPMFLSELAERFDFHATEYDGRYADFLAERGVA
jgi:hemerythrin